MLAPPSAFCSSRRSTLLREVSTRIEHEDPDLDTDSRRFRYAIILLLGEVLAYNIDRISRLSGYPQPFVARAARKLYDHGVWRDGATIGEWSAEGLGPSFWNDVEVAAGTLYRRTAEDGTFEWGAPGSWWKSLHFGDTSEVTAAPIRYSPAVPTGAPELFDSFGEADEELEEIRGGVGSPSGFGDLPPRVVDASWGQVRLVGSNPHPVRAPGPTYRESRESIELFPDAIWLG
jgi:hypothetical protein